MCAQPRTLSPGQRSQIWVHDAETGGNSLILETRTQLLEAPNWTMDGKALIVNGEGGLWRIDLAAPALRSIAISVLPPANNDHVLDPDGQHIYVSAYDDWQIYRAPLGGGKAVQVTGRDGPDGMLHFLHGVSPDGTDETRLTHSETVDWFPHLSPDGRLAVYLVFRKEPKGIQKTCGSI